MKKKQKTETKPQVGDNVTYRGKAYKVVQILTFGLAIIESETERICVQYEALKKEA